MAEIDGCRTPGIVSKSGSDNEERGLPREERHFDRFRQTDSVIGPRGQS